MKQNSYVSRLVWFYRHHGRGVVIWGSFATVFFRIIPVPVIASLLSPAPAIAWDGFASLSSMPHFQQPNPIRY